jgi:probable rRNA maturation factor
MFSLQTKLLEGWRTARRQAAVAEAQRRGDSAVLGVVGLEDS